MDSQSAAKPPRAIVFWAVWLTILALAAGSFFFMWRFRPPAAKATVFRQTAQGWETLPPLASAGYGFAISDSGVAWVQTRTGLNRLDGASWHRFPASGFDSEYSYLPGFTLDGDDVWAGTSDGAVRFDGKSWRRYPNSLAKKRAASIAAVHGKVWQIDHEGNLSHFDGAAWAVRKLDLPGVQWSSWSSADPKLAATVNGVVWLAFQGLWRYDGASWTRIPGVTRKAQLLGVTAAGTYAQQLPDGVWVQDGGELVGFSEDGAEMVRFKMRDLGLLDSTKVYAVAGRAPVFALSSSQGVVRFEGKRWDGDQPKALGISWVSRVAVAPDGSLWGIGYPPAPAGPPLYDKAASASFILLIVAVCYPVWWWQHKAGYQRRVTREAVLHATGALPEDLQAPEPTGLQTTAGVMVGLVLLGGSYWLLRRYWPTAPLWLLPAVWVAVHAIGTVSTSLKRRKPLPSDPITPGGLPHYDWAKSRTPILGSLALVVLLYGRSIARYFHIPWLMFTPSFVFLFGGQFLFREYDILRARRVEREIKQCRYAKALEMLDGPLGWPSTGRWKLVRSDALFFSGQVRDAEATLNDLVETHHDAAQKTLAFEHLGRVLMADGRYDAARRAFEAAAKLKPNLSAAYSGLAELRLLQGVEAAQALADTERALQLSRGSLLERKGAREHLASIRGNQAWALALLGRSAESQQAIEAGTREIDPHSTPEAAGFYWRAGMAMLAIENATAAASHFRRAADLDPQGYYGRLAAQRLSRHSVWGEVGIAAGRG